MPSTEKELEALKIKLARLESEQFGQYISNVRQNRKFYELDFGVQIVPPKWQSYIKPFIPETAARAIDEPADHILNYPHIKVPVRPTEDDSEAEQVIAAVKRVALNSWWSSCNRIANIIGDGKRTFLNEGRICVKKVINWDLVPDKPERDDYESDEDYEKAKNKYRRDMAKLGEVEWPWIVEILDNITVFEDPSNHRDPQYVYVKYDILSEEAKRRWPWDGTGDKPKWWTDDDFNELEYIEYWSKPSLNPDGSIKEPGYYVQWVSGEVVHNEENPYPYIPIFIEDNGRGVVRANAKPHEKYRGMTEKAQYTFIAEAKQLSAWQAVNELSAFPMGVHRNPSSEDPIQIGPGFIIPMEGAENDPNKESLEWMSHPDIPNGVIGLFQTTQMLANQTYKFNILGGVAQSGVETATEADQNVRNAAAVLSAPVAGLTRLVERISRTVLIDVDIVFEAPITIRGTGEGDPAEIKLMPSDIKGFYDVKAELRTSDEDAIAINKARFWIEMALRAPFLSYQTAMVRGEITDDPVTERLRRAAEDVYMSDQFRMIRIMTGAQSFGQLQAALQAGDQNAQSAINQFNSVTETVPTGSPQQDIFGTALQGRDVNQGASQFRGV